MKKLFFPLAWIYSLLASTHRFLYRSKILKKVKLPVPVISVGNLTVGGTGKTPIVDLLVKHFLDHKLDKPNLKVGVVYRAYKAHAKKPVIVQLDSGVGANYYGDEAYLIKNKNPGAVVCSGVHKTDVAIHLLEKEKVDLIIVDDGYQHHKLERDYNILIVDATERLENYSVFPLGRGRESFKGIQRANVVFITKSNLVTKDQLSKVKKILPQNIKAFEFGYQIKNREQIEKIKGKALLVTGVAKPETVEVLLKNSFSNLTTESLSFSDHHEYRPKDINRILNWKEFKKCDAIITTEKDYIKLKELWPKTEKLIILDLELKADSALVEVFQELDSILKEFKL